MLTLGFTLLIVPAIWAGSILALAALASRERRTGGAL